MRDVEDAAEPLFEELRRALAPSHADQARVLNALESRILGDSQPSQYDGGKTVHSVDAAGPRSGPTRLLRLAIVKPLGISVLAAFLGGVGASSFLHTSRTAQPLARLQPTAATRVVPLPPPAPPTPPAPTAPAELSPSAPLTAAASHAPRAHHLASPQRAVVERSVQASAPSLRIELDALQRAELALRDRQPALALAILNECERNVSPGHMREERLAAEFVARCTLFPEQRSVLLSEFTRNYPQSAYATRVQRSCRAH